MRKLAIGICCVLLTVTAISTWQIIFAVQPTPSKKAAQTSENPSRSTPIDTAGEPLSREVVQESQLIATGRCVEVKSAWLDARTLVTLATIEVGEVIKGAQQSQVTVVLPGGIDANRRIPVAVSYPGAPQIATGEEVFLFLTPKEQVPNGFSVTRYAAGKFSINETSDGEKVVSRNFVLPSEQSAARVARQKGVSAVTRTTKRGVPLDEFKEQVRSLLK